MKFADLQWRCLLFFLSLSFVNLSLASNNVIAMPKGLNGISLGMSIEELRKIKPDVKKDDWPRSQLYFETNLDNEFFSFVSYRFIDDKLVMISLSHEGDPDVIRKKTQALNKWCIEKWGEGYSKRIGIIENHPITNKSYEFPIFYWEKQGVRMVMDFKITSNEKFSPNVYELIIFAPRFTLDEVVKAKSKKDTKPEDVDKIEKKLLSPDSNISPLQ